MAVSAPSELKRKTRDFRWTEAEHASGRHVAGNQSNERCRPRPSLRPHIHIHSPSWNWILALCVFACAYASWAGETQPNAHTDSASTIPPYPSLRTTTLPPSPVPTQTSDVAVVHHLRVSATLSPASQVEQLSQGRERPWHAAVAVVDGVAVRFSQRPRRFRDRLARRQISHRPSPRNVGFGGVPGLAASRKRFSQCWSTQMRRFPSSSGLAPAPACCFTVATATAHHVLRSSYPSPTPALMFWSSQARISSLHFSRPSRPFVS